MANVAITGRDHYTNIIEFTGATMSAVNDAMDVPAHSSTYTFAATVTGGANFQLAFECNFNGNGNWFTLDTSKTINSDGGYAYFYDGKAAARVRMRIASISSGTPSILPHIAVGYNG
jgi:threonine dehydrogenase-like Zn-dependent dehydrogenase